MNKFLISYDLNAPNQSYDDLWTLLESFKDSIHIQDSVWLVKSSKSRKEVGDKIQSVVDNDDFWIVVNFDSNISGALEDEVANKVIKLYQD